MKKKKMLVTGVAGFLGSAIFEYLSKKKYFVVGLDVRAIKKKNCFQVNLFHARKLRAFLTKEKPDIIFHLAGGRVADEMKMFDQNIKSTEALINAIENIENYNPLIIQAGSAAEYGLTKNVRKRFNESDLPDPGSLYGKIKLSQTNLALDYYQMGFKIIIARIFNIIGPKTPDSLVAGAYAKKIKQLKGSQKSEIAARNLRAKRDFVDIRDVCEALVKIAEKGKSGKIYNICSGKGFSVEELLTTMLKSAKKKVSIVEDGSDEVQLHSIGSNKRLSQLTNWKPKINFERSVKDTLKV